MVTTIEIIAQAVLEVVFFVVALQLQGCLQTQVCQGCLAAVQGLNPSQHWGALC